MSVFLRGIIDKIAHFTLDMNEGAINMSHQSNLFRRDQRVRIVPAQDSALPEIATRSMTKILFERRTEHDLLSSVPGFWEEQVERRIATDQYRPSHYQRFGRVSIHKAMLFPRLWPFVASLGVTVILVLSLVNPQPYGLGFWAGASFLALIQVLFQYFTQFHLQTTSTKRWGLRFLKYTPFPPFSLIITSQEALARVLKIFGWKRRPFDSIAMMGALYEEEKNSEGWAVLQLRLRRLRERLERLKAKMTVAVADPMLVLEFTELAPLTEDVARALNQVEQRVYRYFVFTVHHRNRSLVETRCSESMDEIESRERQALSDEYLRLYAYLDRAEAIKGSKYVPAEKERDDPTMIALKKSR